MLLSGICPYLSLRKKGHYHFRKFDSPTLHLFCCATQLARHAHGGNNPLPIGGVLKTEGAVEVAPYQCLYNGKTKAVLCPNAEARRQRLAIGRNTQQQAVGLFLQQN